MGDRGLEAAMAPRDKGWEGGGGWASPASLARPSDPSFLQDPRYPAQASLEGGRGVAST